MPQRLLKWLFSRTARELALFRFLGTVLIFVPISLYLTSSWGFVWLFGGLFLHSTIIRVECAQLFDKVATNQIKQISDDVDRQMDTIYQHIRGEKE